MLSLISYVSLLRILCSIRIMYFISIMWSMLCHVIPCYIMWSIAMSYDPLLCHVILCHFVWSTAMSHDPLLCHVIYCCHVIPCCVMWSIAVSCDTRLCQVIHCCIKWYTAVSSDTLCYVILCVVQKVEHQMIGSWLDYIASQPRPAQSLSKTSPLVATLQQTLAKLLKDVQLHLVKADKRWCSWTIYSAETCARY